MSKPVGSVYDISEDAYRSFMHKHLQYYGYYSDKSSYYRNVKASDARQWLSRDNDAEPECSDSDSSDSEDDNPEALVQSQSADKQACAKTSGATKQRRHHDGSQHSTLLTAEEARQLLARYQPARPLPFGTMGPKQTPLWPIELEVLAEQRVRHIIGNAESEPYYVPSGVKVQALPLNASTGKVVFNYDPPSPEFFIRSKVGGSANGPSLYVTYSPSGPKDTTLVFESRFESGNLAKAVQVSEYDYELWLRPDLYTRRHTQWYYFRVSNTCAQKTYRFTIVNFYKPDSLYNHGMKPLFYSEIDAKVSQIGWRRYGDNIKYFPNNVNMNTPQRVSTNENSGGEHQGYYSLTFTFEFSHDDDTCYFAHCYPYTYSDLQEHMNSIYNDNEKSKICKLRMLCKTVAENIVYLLTITEPSVHVNVNEPSRIKSNNSGSLQEQAATQTSEKKRPVVVITARVHPGESNASWMMKGLIEFLISDHSDAKLLRSRYIFKLVPMLNPDGVIVGNYRCGLAGRDLNRQYRSNLKEAYPSVWHTKHMMKKLMDEGYEIALFCDLHGHSRKHNVFMYGCASDQATASRRFQAQLLPFILSQNAPDYFDLDSCKYRIQKSKVGTGRIALWQLGVANSYTMEASFCGSSKGNQAGQHYTTKDYESIMAAHFCKTLLEFSDPDKSKHARIFNELEERAKRSLWERIEQHADSQFLEHLQYVELTLPQLEKVAGRLAVTPDDAQSDDESADSDSSDEPEIDTLPAQVRTAIRKQNRRKKVGKKRREGGMPSKYALASQSAGQLPNKLAGRGKDDNQDDRRKSKQNFTSEPTRSGMSGGLVRGPSIVGLLRARADAQERKAAANETGSRNGSASAPSDSDSQRLLSQNDEGNANAAQAAIPSAKSTVIRRQALSMVKELLYPAAAGSSIGETTVSPVWLPSNSMPGSAASSDLAHGSHLRRDSIADRDGPSSSQLAWKGAPINIYVGEEDDPNVSQRKLIRPDIVVVRSGFVRQNFRGLQSQSNAIAPEAAADRSEASNENERRLSNPKPASIMQRQAKILGIPASELKPSQPLERSILKTRSFSDVGSLRIAATQPYSSKK